MKIVNPATEEVIAEISEDNEISLSEKFRLLTEAQKEWSLRDISDRVKILQKFSELIKRELKRWPLC